MDLEQYTTRQTDHYGDAKNRHSFDEDSIIDPDIDEQLHYTIIYMFGLRQTLSFDQTHPIL